MKALYAFIICLVSALLLGVPANAAHRGSQSTTFTKCPYGDATPNDGCIALYQSGLQGTVQFPNCFTTDTSCAVGSGQTFVRRLEENQAGVDFPVGVPQIYNGSLRDPANIASYNANCAYDSKGAFWTQIISPNLTGSVFSFASSSNAPVQTGERVNMSGAPANTLITTQIDATHWNVSTSTGSTLTGSSTILSNGPRVSCTGSLPVEQFEFGPWTGTGPHLSTVLNMVNSTAATVRYSHFQVDDNTWYASNLNDYAINLGSTTTVNNINFSYNTVNGECFVAGCGGQWGNFQVVLYTAGTKTLDYDAFLGMPGRITAGCGSSSGAGTACPTQGVTNITHTFFQGPTNSNPAFHGELMEDIPAPIFPATEVLGVNYIGDVVTIPAGADGDVTTLIYASGGGVPVGPPNYDSFTVSDSTLADNLSNLGAAIASAGIDFQNGNFSNVTIKNVAFGMITGPTHAVRADCGNVNFTGSIDASGVLTVTGSIISGDNKIIPGSQQGSLLWFNGAASGIRVTSQLTGTTGGDGTYQTTYSGAGISSRAMTSYGNQGSATIFNNPYPMTNVFDMTTGNALTVFGSANFCYVPYPL
jgi:hypothetical protein